MKKEVNWGYKEWVIRELKYLKANGLTPIYKVICFIIRVLVMFRIPLWETKELLNKLVNREPLTPIVDEDNIWGRVSLDDNYKTYQCSRLTSLFKEVYNDGAIKYFDVNGYELYNLDPTLPKNDGACYNGFVNSVMDDLYPLEMPYAAPLKKPAVYFARFVSREESENIMIIGIISMVEPDGNHIKINKFYKFDDDSTPTPISRKEYYKRRKTAIWNGR